MANTAERTEDSGLIDLVKDAIKDTQELIQIEVALAKNEVKQDVSKVRNAAIAFGVALAASLLMIAMLLVAVVLSIGGGPVPALVIAAVLFGIAGVGALVGYNLIPREVPLDATAKHAKAQATVLKEEIA